MSRTAETTTMSSKGQRGSTPRPQAVKDNVELVMADQALSSLRASGHDYCSAVGEVLDNSLQANANTICVRLFTDKRVIGANSRKVEVVEQIAIGDDGDGMSREVLRRALQMGFSSRYNDRTGMGRFGVGAKLGGISQCRRIELYSRTSADDPWLYTYIDLDEIRDGAMRFIPEPRPAGLPADCTDLVGTDHGTLVLWSKTDKLAERATGGARQAGTVESDMVNYVARTFRTFLDGGIRLSVNDRQVRPHDPLFLMRTTRFHDTDTPDPVATELLRDGFDWPVPGDADRNGHVEVTVTLLPEALRPHRGSGGEKPAKERRIDENEGISILRAGREIFFGYLPGVQPSIEKVDIDRWVGIEIRFSPDLDECFQVRNIKKGAEPVNGLKDKLRDMIFNTVMTARKQIKAFWDHKDSIKRREAGAHSVAEDIAARTKDQSPKPRAGQQTTTADRDRKIREAAEQLAKEKPEQRQAVEEEIRRRPLTIVPQSWPGNELMEVDHLGDNTIVRINMRHPFYREVYSKLLTILDATDGDTGSTSREAAELALVGLDLFILAYARAEGMRANATDNYSDLRTYWSLHLKNMAQEWAKSREPGLLRFG